MKRLSKRIGVVAAGPALVAALSASIAGAQEHRASPPPAANCFLFVFCSLPSTPGANWQLYKESGTLGRQGLGASPFHPEGPGNRSY